MEEVKVAESRALEVVAREPDPKLSENALRVLQKRYLKKDDKGRVIETPKELFARVAWNLAQAERNYGATEAQVEETARRFFRIISTLEFLPNSPTLMNAGLELQLLSACFVLPVDDSLVGIFDALKQQALIHQGGGGTGFAFSRLRPKGDFVKSTMGVASGPVSFMKIFDAATQTVKQGGCISVDSLLRTSEGLKPLGRLLNSPPLGENFTRDRVFDGKDYSHALIAQDNGPAEIYSIETELGLRIGVTYNHALAVVEKSGEIVWREAQDLKEGDWLVIVKGGHLGLDKPLLPLGGQHPNATRIRVPAEMNSDLSELLGLYMADGCTSSGGRFIITVGTVDIEVMERIRILMDKIFGLAPNRITEGEGGGYVDIQFQSRDLVRWMERLGWVKGSSPNAFVPSAVLTGSADTARAFLRGLFEGDGHLHSGSGYPSFSTTSERLAIEAQQLLLSLGVVARRGTSRNRERALGHRTVHTLSMVGEHSVRTLSEEIGFVSDRKQERLELGPRPMVNTSDVIPNQAGVLRSSYSFVGRGSGPGRSRRGANRRLYRALMHYISEEHPRALPRKRLVALMKRFPEIGGNEHLRAMSDVSKVYTHITAIRPDRAPTADLEVPGPASFVANGVLVHNKRRGANMGILRVDHPDILEFITCKDRTTEITNFNISVAITDKFMESVLARTSYDLVNPRDQRVVGQLDAREVLDKIAFQAWKNGEPGLFFIDENNRRQPTPHVADMEATNPCGEQPLLPYESCNLGSIDLARHMKRSRTGGGEVDWKKLEGTIRTTVRLLDDVIDMNANPVKQIEEMTYATRKIGLGSKDIVKKILENHGTPRGLKEVAEKWQRVVATAHEVPAEWHVRMQAAFQDACDAAVSKTINMPREATVEDVKKAYLLAYDLHCKGITVYRDGSREDQVLNIGVAESGKPTEMRVEVPPEPAALRPRPRPDVITGRTQKILTGYGALYVTVNEDEKGLFEVFAQIGRGGGYTASFTEGIARLVSLCLRSGVPVDEIIDQLEGIRSPRIAVDHGERVYSIPDAIAKAIKRHIGMQKTGVQPPVETFDELGGAVETDVELEKESRDAAELLRKGLNPECPECGKSLVFEEGCVKCHACGYSEC